MRYPDLSQLNRDEVISVDIETKDPDLKKYGPSNYRDPRGNILGVAIAAGNHAEYYNYSNEHDNNYIRDTLSLPNTKIGHSLLYDVGWLESDNIPVAGTLHDVMIAEALIDNTKPTYDLDSIGVDYLAETKSDQEIISALAARGIIPTKSHPVQDYLHLLPHDIVRPYAIQDVQIPLKAHKKQELIMRQMDLLDLYDMESKLLRVLLHMRRLGVPYDTDVSQQCSIEAKKIYDKSKYLIKKDYYDINPNSPKEIEFVFGKLDINVPFTDKGNPSITRAYLEHLIENEGLEKLSVADYLPLLVLNCRRLGKSEKDYIEGIRNNFLCSDGRTVRCTYHPTRGEEYGTVSGRFSCSHPNLQQITSAERDSFIGGLCRRPFVPLPGCDWIKIDYSQIEYRFMAHYAKGPGSKEIRERYNNDPNTDYHAYIVELTGLHRPVAKNLNFGIAFGMGVQKMMAIYGWSEYKVREILETYHGNAPFIKYTMRDVERVSLLRGRIKTILKRVSHLTDKRKAYVMYNRLIQGSAADLMKKGMVDLLEAGMFDYMYPHLTIHDEIDFSVPKGNRQLELIKEAKYIMESAIDIRVPILAEVSIGPNWADVEKMKEE